MQGFSSMLGGGGGGMGGDSGKSNFMGGDVTPTTTSSAQSGDIYAAWNAPFIMGGGSKSAADIVGDVVPWVVAGVVAWAVLRK